MAQQDEILVKYKADYNNIKAGAEQVHQEFVEVENAGTKAFDAVGASANKAAAGIASFKKQTTDANKQVSGLNNSISQISRELPAFAFGGATGIAALTNNIGPLIDSFSRLREQNKLLAAEGKETQSVAKALGSAIFSLNTLVSIGVTVFALYGKEIGEFFSKLVKGKADLRESVLFFQELNNVLKNGKVADQATEYDRLSKNIKLAKSGVLDKKKVLEQYNSTIGQTLGVTNDFNIAEQKIVNGKDAYVKSMIDRATANGLLAKANEAMIKRIELANSRLEIGFFDSLTDEVGKPSAASQRRKQELKELQDLENAYKQLAEKVIGNRSYADQTVESNRKEAAKKTEDAILVELRGRLEIEKNLKHDTYDLELQIFNRRMELEKKGSIEFRKIELEKQAYIAGVNQQRYEDQVKQYDNEYKLASQSFERFKKDFEERKKEGDKQQQDNEKNIHDQYLEENKIVNRSFEERREALNTALEDEYITKEEYSKASRELDQAEVEARLQTIAAVADALQGLAELAGENTELGKGLAAASAIIDTYQAASAAFAGFQKDLPQPYGVIAGTAAVVGIVAAGLARVQKIYSVTVPKPSTRKNIKTEVQTFATGVVDLQGPGTTTSDSIPAWLSRGESVIKASSTAGYRDELKALNKSPLDYERMIMQKYVEPVLDQERKKNARLAENLVNSMALQGAFNDKNIVKAIKENRPATKNDITDLTSAIEKQTRQTRFEQKLYKKA